ncbi:MAG TPA: hypothetical protein VFE98_09360 [Candidatus Bathyarchaeia archaeon]|nr:hypothetical protein [Candidatus Bathyarchaeia archaeon]
MINSYFSKHKLSSKGLFSNSLEKVSRHSKTPQLRCIACKKAIMGKPLIMILQITSDEARFIEKAKKLGFSSKSWQSGGSIKGDFHKDCFDQAKLIWEIAFETRALSPRR